MFSTLLVIGGVLAGLLVLLALIVTLSARPAAGDRAASGRPDRSAGWVADVGRRHPDAWAPVTTTSEIPAIR
ncbi:hypothetical protein OF117_13135 [Geodermatophilus sp. YIM 151500]|uniref:hypothetical protein n=1 Tax=Geodermatophilus sp. YIM 151500 TaxID=2984531 RepID=UPI0021E452AF|nr:hypothetical protein [Geodermatophilus sp. YIM 151500]MCV2490310.1 hypothetical protein [Geodermatophilus sp. YIM 151500]